MRALPLLMLSLPLMTMNACRLGYELFGADGAGAAGGFGGGSSESGGTTLGAGGAGNESSGGSDASGGSSQSGGSNAKGGSSANAGSATDGSSQNGGANGNAGASQNGGMNGNAGSSQNGGATSGNGGSAGSGGAAQVDPCSDWHDPAFTLRLRLDFDNSAGEALQSFVALVVLDSMSIDYAEAGANGSRVRFVDADQKTVLKHHIERWDAAGKSYVWVQVPTIDAASTTDHIWLYYGGTGSGTENQTGTYDASFAGVWHLSDAGPAILDSTSAAITCKWFGAGGNFAGPGIAGGGISTSGTNNGADSGAGKLPALTNQTITIWARPPAGGGGDQNQALFSGEQTTGNYSGPGIHMFGAQARVGTYVNLNYRYGGPGLALTRGAWNFVALRGVAAASNGYVEMKVNAGAWESVYTGDTTTLQATANSEVQIGDYDPAIGTTDFLGDLDQLVISSSLRSDSWISAQYRSEGDSGFVVKSLPQACK